MTNNKSQVQIMVILLFSISWVAISCSRSNKESGHSEFLSNDTSIIIASNMLGRWVLTDYFETIRTEKVFWTKHTYPDDWFVDLEITQNSITPLGWNESAVLDCKAISKTKIRTNGTDQFWFIEYDYQSDQITTEYHYKDSIQWSYTFERFNNTAISDARNFELMIKRNCLVGNYLDIETGRQIEINDSTIDGLKYSVVTDYLDLPVNGNTLFFEDKDTPYFWDWQSDTLVFYSGKFEMIDEEYGEYKPDSTVFVYTPPL